MRIIENIFFENSDVLPEFKELILVKAVQTQADAKDSRFKDWFEGSSIYEGRDR